MNSNQDPQAVIFNKHNHDICFKTTLEAAENHCSENNLEFTPLRRKVFEILLKDHKPLGAYKILDLLREAGFSSTPPIAYRVLDFLIKHGFAHKIKGRNAFVACSHLGSFHSPAFMICRKCENIAEVDSKKTKVTPRQPNPLSFKVEETIIEMIGLCNTCFGEKEV